MVLDGGPQVKRPQRDAPDEASFLRADRAANRFVGPAQARSGVMGRFAWMLMLEARQSKGGSKRCAQRGFGCAKSPSHTSPWVSCAP